jgi:hypothetical protein
MSEGKKIEIEVPVGYELVQDGMKFEFVKIDETLTAPSKPFFANSLLGSSKYFSTFSFAAAINLSNCAFSFSCSDAAFSSSG